MEQQNFFRNISILILILVVGFGLAAALTSLAQAGSRQVQTGRAAMTGYSPFQASEPSRGSEQAPNPSPKIYHAAKTGDGSDGLTWPTTYTNVQDALYEAFQGNQIWVATGEYTPGTSQTDSFNLKPSVELYGGFKFGDIQFSDRNWVDNITVLSGDIDGDDITDANGVVTTTSNIVLFNAYHVLEAKNVTETAVLDGFTITAGKASASFPDSLGGGLYCDGSGFNNFLIPF